MITTADEIATRRYATAHGLDMADAYHAMKRAQARQAARDAAADAARTQRAHELETQADQPITDDWAKKIDRYLTGANKARRATVIRVLGDRAAQRVLNPQTRAAAITTMTTAQARRILGK